MGSPEIGPLEEWRWTLMFGQPAAVNEADRAAPLASRVDITRSPNNPGRGAPERLETMLRQPFVTRPRN